jgi:hypothetical protein
MANDYTLPSSTAVYVSQINDSAADLATNLGNCQLGIANDTKQVVFKNNSGVSTTLFSNASLTTGYIPKNDGVNLLNSIVYQDAFSRIGVGTTSPAQKLHVGSGSILIDQNYNIMSSNNILKLSETTTQNMSLTAIGDLVVSNNGSETFRISVLGKVGIGTDNPIQKLHVAAGSINIDRNYGLRGNDTNIITMYDASTHDIEMTSANNVLLNCFSLDINADNLRIRTAKTPANSSDTGIVGQVCWDTSYLYVCTATNTWKRIALAW